MTQAAGNFNADARKSQITGRFNLEFPVYAGRLKAEIRTFHETSTVENQKLLARQRIFRQNSGTGMKAKIIVTPKKAVVDPQGKTVQGALEQMGYKGVAAVHVGKYIEIDLAPGTDKAAAQAALSDAAHKFLSNPIIEDYKLEISE
jgi:phosphoribosylformylglycinamidine synthase PurS subunit